MPSERSARRGRARERQRGASLVELVVALPLFFVVLLGVYLLYEASEATTARAATDAALQGSGRHALDEMARFLRMAGADPTGAGTFGFRAAAGFTPLATESRILFTLDADGDGVLANSSGERVGFALFGSDLRRTLDGVTPLPGLPPLARDVRGLRFGYFTAAEVPLPNPPGPTYTLTVPERMAIRRVTIQLTLSAAAPGQAPRLYTLTTDVRPRNL